MPVIPWLLKQDFNHNNFCEFKPISETDNRLNSVEPNILYIYNIANNIHKLPNKVYKNNKKLARTLAWPAPHTPIIKNKGIYIKYVNKLLNVIVYNKVKVKYTMHKN